MENTRFSNNSKMSNNRPNPSLSMNIDNIPYAKSVSSLQPSQNQNFPNSNFNTFNQKAMPFNNSFQLPPIPKTPLLPKEKYNEAYDNCTQARGLIQTRLNKLNYEKKLLGEMKQNFNPYSADYESIYKLRTLGNAKGKLGNPHLYNNQFMDPIYYPLEMPICAEPVTLPKIEIGHPMSNTKKCCHGLGIEELLALLAAFKKNQPPIVYPPPQQPIIYPPQPFPAEAAKRKRKIKGKKQFEDLNKKAKIPDVKKKTDDVKRGLKRDWWRLARDFCNTYAFFSIGRKYAGFAKVRDNIIAERNKRMVQDITVLKEWVISITQSFWDEFKVFTDLNVSFKNIDSKLKITRESQKIIAMIRKYLESLISNSTKLVDIPERVQQIIYSYIKDKGYFPKNYLSTYQINRIDYNFNGGTKNLQGDQVGMLVAFLIISGISVQQILLHMKDCFVEFKNYPNIEISAKYIGSIMHYLTRDTFNNNPTMLKEILALMNYYRNYHIYNKAVESQDDIFNNNMEFRDEDEFADYLVPESQITEFWNINSEFVETYKNYVYAWACRLGKLIRLKYQKTDPNLQPRKGLERPPDKTAKIEVEKRQWEEEYEEEVEDEDGK